ncbi:MAG: hypothetical protein SFZ03_04360 [Candidatus Melainabacteria bacterium]|nr:hypothetical protein [Candidatus Melainabacteria bacterium]
MSLPSAPASPVCPPPPLETAQQAHNALFGRAWLWPRASLSVSLFTLGVGTSLGLPVFLKSLLPGVYRALAGVGERLTPTLPGSALQRGLSPEKRLGEVLFLFNDPMSALFKLVHESPKTLPVVAAYGAVATMGFVAGNLFKGLQEAWIRFEESCIRADLLSRLKTGFQQSIHLKNALDGSIRQQAKGQIVQLLQQAGVPNPLQYVQPGGLPAVTPQQHRNFFYQPTQLQVQFGQTGQPFSIHSAPLTPSPQGPFFSGGGAANPAYQGLFGWLQPLPIKHLVAVGSYACGLAVGQLARLMFQTASAAVGRVEDLPVSFKNITMYDREAVYIDLARFRNNGLLMAGFFSLTGLMTVGKLFVDGLREIEVTRWNAETEYRYQRHNWLALDPAFHQIAENEALSDALGQLRADLPWLRQNPTLLYQRTQRILGNIGLNSAPKYFLMTPIVGLVDARG